MGYHRCMRVLMGILLLQPMAALATQTTSVHQCDVISRTECRAGTCVETRPWAFYLISPEPGVFSRCDEAGCDILHVQVTRQGDSLRIQVPGQRIDAMWSPDRADFIEMAAIERTYTMSEATCREVQSDQ